MRFSLPVHAACVNSMISGECSTAAHGGGRRRLLRHLSTVQPEIPISTPREQHEPLLNDGTSRPDLLLDAAAGPLLEAKHLPEPPHPRPCRATSTTSKGRQQWRDRSRPV